MMPKKSDAQLERFKEGSRELGTDDDERFEEWLKKLVKQKPMGDEASDA